MFNRVVCIELGALKTRICEAECGKRHTRIYRCISFDTPKNAVDDGYIRDRDAITGVLKDKLKEAGIKADRFIFTIASTRIACREAVMPLVKDSRIQDVVNANFAEYFPVDISEFISAFSVVGKASDGKDKTLRLFVLAAPESMVKDYYDIAGKLGGEIAAVDYAGNSSCRVYALDNCDEASLIVRVGSRMTFLNVLDNGVLSLPRSLSYGSDALAGNCNGSDGKLSDLAGDIARIIEYYTRKEDKRINSVYINGQMLHMPGFTQLIKQQLGIEAKSLTVRDTVRFHSGLSLSEAEKEEYLCCIGAAISPVNFIPRKFLEKYRKSGSIHNFLFALSASAAIGAILIAGSYFSYRSEKMKNTFLKEEIERLSGINRIYEEYAAEEERYRIASRIYDLTADPNDGLVNLLDELEKKLPADATVETLSVNSSGITLSLRTSSEITAAAAISQLKKIPLLSQVKTGAITLLEDENKVRTVKFIVTGIYGIGEKYHENEKNVGS